MNLVTKSEGELVVSLSIDEARSLLDALSDLVEGPDALTSEEWADRMMQPRDRAERLMHELDRLL